MASKNDQTDDAAHRIVGDEATLRQAFTQRNGTAAAAAHVSLLKDVLDARNVNQSDLYDKIDELDRAKGLRPLVLYDPNSDRLDLRPDAKAQLNGLDQARGMQNRDETLDNDAKGLAKLSPWALNFDAQGSGDEALLRNFPNAQPLIDFKQHLRDAHAAGGADGMKDYINEVDTRLAKMKAPYRLELGRRTRAMPGDPDLKPGDYGEVRVRELAGGNVNALTY